MTGMARKAAALLIVTLLASALFLPVPAGAEEPSPPRWGLGFRAGYYGVPDWILDRLFEEHPSVDGSIVGVEFRHYGSGGPRGIFSVGLTLDVGQADGVGVWKENGDSIPVTGGGDVNIAAGTVTLYWDLWPGKSLHPYFGAGAGVGYADGSYVEEGEEINVKEFVPVIHIPVGLVLNLGETFSVGLEGRIIDGISWGGIVQLRF